MQYCIEICGERNKSYYFPPLKEKIRGRYDQAKMGHLSPGEIARVVSRECPVIPGECIMVDSDTFTGRVFDPMKETPEGREVHAKLKSIANRYQHHFGGKTELRDAREFQLDPDKLKDWLHWMARCKENRMCVEFPGSDPLPSLKEIAKLPGKRLRDPFSSMRNDPEGKFADVVPVPKSYGPKLEAAAAD